MVNSIAEAMSNVRTCSLGFVARGADEKTPRFIKASHDSV